jgi:hypothetical protein
MVRLDHTVHFPVDVLSSVGIARIRRNPACFMAIVAFEPAQHDRTPSVDLVRRPMAERDRTKIRIFILS